jgi:hypothetical protein
VRAAQIVEICEHDLKLSFGVGLEKTAMPHHGSGSEGCPAVIFLPA